MFCINGRFLTRPITGVDRFAREILCELDAILDSGEAIVAMPQGVELVDPPILRNIDLIRCGKFNGHVWEQLFLGPYIRKHRFIGINLCNTAPIINPGIVCIHDMAASAHPEFYSKRGLNWRKIRLAYITRRADAILTVSRFSENEIHRYYPHTIGKTEVVYNAWQHIRAVEPDTSSLERFGLQQGEYFFALSSLSPNKNLKWIVSTALINSECTFAIAGGINTKVFGQHDFPQAPNVKYLGRVNDAEAKALMQGCKAFLFPSLYEGFGIPPMESIACGAKAMVSDIEVMHEVYGDGVIYVDNSTPLLNIEKWVEKEGPSRFLVGSTGGQLGEV